MATITFRSKEETTDTELKVDGWQATEQKGGFLSVYADSGDVFVNLREVEHARVDYDHRERA